MPRVFLGTWKAPPSATEAAVRAALDCGYRALDCANDYDNEPDVGRAVASFLKENKEGVKREDLFIQVAC